MLLHLGLDSLTGKGSHETKKTQIWFYSKEKKKGLGGGGQSKSLCHFFFGPEAIKTKLNAGSQNVDFTEHGMFTLLNYVSNCKTASFTRFC